MSPDFLTIHDTPEQAHSARALNPTNGFIEARLTTCFTSLLSLLCIINQFDPYRTVAKLPPLTSNHRSLVTHIVVRYHVIELTLGAV